MNMDKDRDIPKPPIVERYFYGEYDREKMRYCCRCGQAIDWRGTYGHEEK